MTVINIRLGGEDVERAVREPHKYHTQLLLPTLNGVLSL